MTIHIEKEKLEKFNNFVNDNNLFDEYKDIDGRNKWNIICSCMDWIDTAITYIESFEEFNNNPHISSMQIYSLLSAADMISESINQLHRVLLPSSALPFKSHKEIFKSKLDAFENQDDNSYFKELRAIFGAHPTNLTPNKELNELGNRYASFPKKHTYTNNFSITLYSNELEKGDVEITLNFNEVINFLTTRYSYLDTLLDRLK